MVTKFKRAHGDLQGVAMSPNNIAVQWEGPGRIIFSFAQRGNAISAHFSSNKKGLRSLKKAMNDFCDWIFTIFEWCKMILGVIKKEMASVVRTIKKCEFFYVASTDDYVIYARVK